MAVESSGFGIEPDRIPGGGGNAEDADLDPRPPLPIAVSTKH